MELQELHWLAGLLEGEGSFMHGPPSAPWQPSITIAMTDRDVVERVAELLGVAYVHTASGRKAAHKTSYATRVKGAPAIALMQQLRPLMGARRAAKIAEILARYALKPPHAKQRLSAAEIAAIRAAEEPNITHLAAQYNIARTTVRMIRAGFTSSTAYKKARKPQ